MRDAMKFQYLLLVFGFGYQQLGIDEILFGGAKELSDVFADGSIPAITTTFISNSRLFEALLDSVHRMQSSSLLILEIFFATK
jgi:hypothetical protein